MADPKGYAYGHNNSYTAAHAARSASSCASFLLPHLRPDMKILDMGCGPGSITCDLASLVPQGSVTGVDISDQVLDQARSLAASRKLPNATFITGDVQKGLGLPDASFDAIYTGQLFPHLSDPVSALKELRRLLRPGGVLASRNHIATLWHPNDKALEGWERIAGATVLQRGALHPDAGRWIGDWAREVGFETTKIHTSIGGYLNSTPEARASQLAVTESHMESGSKVRQASLKAGVAEDEFGSLVTAVRKWAGTQGAWHSMVCAETLCWNWRVGQSFWFMVSV